MKVKVIPNGDEGDTKKETEGATKVGNLQREIKTIILDVGSVQTSTIKSSISDRQIQIHKYTNKQIHKYTNIHIYTNTQTHKYTYTQIHKHTNTQIPGIPLGKSVALSQHLSSWRLPRWKR